MANNSRQTRNVRKGRVRYKIKQVRGDRKRLSIFRSAKHIYAQIIDDDQGATLASASTVEKEVLGEVKSSGSREAAAQVGKAIAARAKEKNITRLVFDRGGFLYHGRTKALADAAREAGLEF